MEELVQQELVSVKFGQLYVMMKRIREGERWDIVASSPWRVRETTATTRVEEGKNGNIVVEGNGQTRRARQSLSQPLAMKKKQERNVS